MDASVAALLGFVAENKAWALWVVLALAILDSTAFLSIFVPSTPLLVGVGALVSAGALEFTPIWLGASLGGVIGSTFSWWVGHHYGAQILQARPFRLRPDLTSRAAAAINRWGVWVILVSHVFSPLTAAVFLVAGVAKIPFGRFQAVNVPGALAWAWLIPKFGEWGGDLAHMLWVWFTGT